MKVMVKDGEVWIGPDLPSSTPLNVLKQGSWGGYLCHFTITTGKQFRYAYNLGDVGIMAMENGCHSIHLNAATVHLYELLIRSLEIVI